MCAHSCGAVADLHRLPVHPLQFGDELYVDEISAQFSIRLKSMLMDAHCATCGCLSIL